MSFWGFECVFAAYDQDRTLPTHLLRLFLVAALLTSLCLFRKEDLLRVMTAAGLELPVPFGENWIREALRPERGGHWCTHAIGAGTSRYHGYDRCSVIAAAGDDHIAITPSDGLPSIS
jgi:hypothetical protein